MPRSLEQSFCVIEMSSCRGDLTDALAKLTGPCFYHIVLKLLNVFRSNRINSHAKPSVALY